MIFESLLNYFQRWQIYWQNKKGISSIGTQCRSTSPMHSFITFRNSLYYITLHYRYFTRHLHLKWPVVHQQSYIRQLVYASVNRWVFSCLLKVHVSVSSWRPKGRSFQVFSARHRRSFSRRTCASIMEVLIGKCSKIWAFLGQTDQRLLLPFQTGRQGTADMHQMHKYA